MKTTMCDNNGNGALCHLSLESRVTGSNATEYLNFIFCYFLCIKAAVPALFIDCLGFCVVPFLVWVGSSPGPGPALRGRQGGREG